jgi:hypothetical protein
MWSNVVEISRTVQECAQRKVARFVLLTRCSQRDIFKEGYTVVACDTRGSDKNCIMGFVVKMLI